MLTCEIFCWKRKDTLSGAQQEHLFALIVVDGPQRRVKAYLTSIVCFMFFALSNLFSVAQESSTSVPPFKLAHEDYRNPIALVVAESTTDQQIVSLLRKIRSSVRSHSFTNIGLQPANDKNHYNISGMIEVFRGRKCVSETYTEGIWPCGDGEHYAGFYQWGLGGLPLDAETRFAVDSGGYRKRNGAMEIIFTKNDGHTSPR